MVIRALFLAAAALSVSSATLAKDDIVFKSLADLDKCARDYRYDTGVCLEPLEAYAKNNPKQMFEIAKRARLQFQHWAALRFFEPALGKSPDAAQCADKDLALAVVSGIALPPSYDGKAVADRIFAGACFAALRPIVEKEIAAANGAGYLWQNGCKALAEKAVKFADCDPKPVAAAVVPAAPETLPTVNLANAKIGLVKVYRGSEGERVTMADLPETAGAFVVRVDGVRSSINGKPMLHKETVNGRRAEYWTEIDGKRWVTITVSGDSYKTHQLYVPGMRGAINVSYSQADTKEAKADSLQK